jgi:hypothetical protein
VFALNELQKSVLTTVTQNWLSWIVKPHPTTCPGWPDRAPLTGFNVSIVTALPAEANTPANKTVWKIRLVLLGKTVCLAMDLELLLFVQRITHFAYS